MMAKRRPKIAVVGGGRVNEAVTKTAQEVGSHIGLNEAILVCGGLGGVMEAAARGAKEAGGTVVGILPGESAADANPYVDIAIPTGMGVGRNVLVVRTADVLIALPGAYGTLSEIAIALNLGKTVVYLPGSWNLTRIGTVESALFKEAFEPAQAVGLALNACL
jgi:hypothetical protein